MLKEWKNYFTQLLDLLR